MPPKNPDDNEPAPLLAFGAHPDDIEFGAGGIIAREAHAGRPVHFAICSRGEAGTHGTPGQRTKEAARAAKLLGATLEFVDLDGDARLELKSAHALRLAGIIRNVRPGIVLAPSLEQNQHPDHWRLGTLVRDACRLARYGGLEDLKPSPHVIGQLFFYALGANAEPAGVPPILIDVSRADVMSAWTTAMEAHASQMKTRNYVDLQLARARIHGMNAGVEHAQPLWPDGPMLVGSLEAVSRGARKF